MVENTAASITDPTLHYTKTRTAEFNTLQESLDERDDDILEASLQLLGESTLLGDGGKEVSLLGTEVVQEVYRSLVFLTFYTIVWGCY